MRSPHVNVLFTVTAIPGESYHAPHAPLRQRLSVGGGPAQVHTQLR